MRPDVLHSFRPIRTFVLGVCALLLNGLLQPSDAHAERRFDPGAAAIIGAIGGFALGATVAGAPPAPYYGRPYYRGDEWRWHRHPHYWGPPPEDCYVVRERVWIEGWGWDVRPRTVCQ
jgi:hypothetical protein